LKSQSADLGILPKVRPNDWMQEQIERHKHQVSTLPQRFRAVRRVLFALHQASRRVQILNVLLVIDQGMEGVLVGRSNRQNHLSLPNMRLQILKSLFLYNTIISNPQEIVEKQPASVV